MNEQKLKDLAEQAGFDVKRLMAPHPGGFPREDMLALESFAELIVRECLQVINQPNGVGDDDVIRISDNVKQHFGVEE
jgi:hypothetical protein